MDFALSDEQEMIRASAEGFLADVSDCAAVRAAMVSETGYDTDLWQRLCNEMYWPAIHIPEAYGGLGLGFVELAILPNRWAGACCARRSSPLPAWPRQRCCWPAPRRKTALAAGHRRRPCARHRSLGRWGGWSAEGIGVTATPEGEGYVLDGEYAQVIDGHSADLLVVAARLAGSTGEAGVSLFWSRPGRRVWRVSGSRPWTRPGVWAACASRVCTWARTRCSARPVRPGQNCRTCCAWPAWAWPPNRSAAPNRRWT